MSLIWMDGFNHYYTSTQLSSNGYTNRNAYMGNNLGRFSEGVCARMGGSGWIKRILPTTYTTLFAGFALKQSGYTLEATVSSEGAFIFLDESGVKQVVICFNSLNEVVAYNGDGTVLGTGTGGPYLPLYGWSYLEARVTISATAGIVIVYINGQEALNLTSQNTKNGTDYIGYMLIGCPRGFENYGYIDDFYIDDSQFHGNCHVKTFMPDSDGTHSDFTRSTGSADYEPIDEHPPVDTDYIFSNTVGHKSTFGITTGVLTTVKGIQLNNRLVLGTAGTRMVKPLLRSNSTDYAGGAFTPILDTEKYYSRVYDTDPDDSGEWTQAKLEAAEFGLEIAS